MSQSHNVPPIGNIKKGKVRPTLKLKRSVKSGVLSVEEIVEVKSLSGLNAGFRPKLKETSATQPNLEEIVSETRKASREEDKFFEDRKKRGLGVGRSDDGKLIFQKSQNRIWPFQYL